MTDIRSQTSDARFQEAGEEEGGGRKQELGFGEKYGV